MINLTTVFSLFGTKLNYIRTGELPTNEDPTALHRYIPSPRDREEANQHTAQQKMREQIAALKRQAESLKRENESLKNSLINDPNVRQSRVTLLQDREYDSDNTSSSSSND